MCICKRCVYVMGLKLDIKVVCSSAPFCLMQSGPYYMLDVFLVSVRIKQIRYNVSISELAAASYLPYRLISSNSLQES